MQRKGAGRVERRAQAWLPRAYAGTAWALGADRRLRVRPLPLHRPRRVSWVSTYRQAGEKRQEVAALKARNTELKERRSELRDKRALEREARRLGMVKAGEKAYVVAPALSVLASEGCRSRRPLEQWREGERRLAEAPAFQQDALERVTAPHRRRAAPPPGRRVHRRRAGRALRAGGHGLGVDLAVATAPEQPYAWDARIVADAAFARYLRGAVDFAGGRRRVL